MYSTKQTTNMDLQLTNTKLKSRVWHFILQKHEMQSCRLKKMNLSSKINLKILQKLFEFSIKSTYTNNGALKQVK